MPHALIDLKGKTFGRLTVLERAGTYRQRWKSVPLWRCRCECGKVKICRGDQLRQNKLRSCSCLRDEMASERMKMNNPKRKGD